MRKLNWLVGMLVLSVAAPVLADHHEREERREDRREDRREERHEERREERRDMRRWSHEAPPPVRVERWEPRRGYVWINGRWGYDGGRYVWEPGRYERERAGFRWREPRWEMRDGVYVRVEGDWVAMGPTMAPPAVRVERFDPRAGFVWIRGRWNWAGGQWAWTPGHYERERAGYIYREPRWEMRGGEYVQVGGTWEVTP